LIARVRRAGHNGQIIIRADSGFENHKLIAELHKQGIEFSIGAKQSKTIRALIDQIPETDWTPVPDYPASGQAQVAEVQFKGFRLIVRRTRLTDPKQLALWPDWRHHCFITNRDIPLLVTDVDHRDHAQIEQVIRDLKDQALAHFPSGNYSANSAWTVIAAIAHNLARWTSLIAHPERTVQTARTRRRQLLRIPGRLVRTARKWTLRLPARWPWAADFQDALTQIRSLPHRT